MVEESWLPYDGVALARLVPAGGEVVDALVGRGLPVDCCRVFVRDRGRELEVRELPAGRAVFLGAFEDGVKSYWLVLGSGAVWMVRGYDDGGGEQGYELVNSSVLGLQRVLAVWEEFVRSGWSDEDDGYEEYVEGVVGRARDGDPEAFGDEEAWWARHFGEVELGVLVPEGA
ncbi:SUKH-4 family immunity protein [Streptomyces albidoflavus]|uniref:SUKH-4 family immunity protein n=1 Tax=Streptomyces albidoflavus TaxID=1886 RepID=UPI0033BE620B